MSADSIDIVYRALIAGELDDKDLSARRIGKLLGKTTSVVYHHFGSLDGLLFRVSQRGYRDLGALLTEAFSRRSDLADVAEAFVVFGLDHLALYPLMFERRFDWERLRAGGAFENTTASGEMLAALGCVLEAAESPDPVADMRLLVSGLHGLVSFAASGRMNAGELSNPDRAVAIAAARDLVRRLVPSQE
jgi:AcrR family transcriptional regulator